MSAMCAVIAPDGSEVINIILCDAQFSIPGCEIKRIPTGVHCAPGMFYNDQNGGYYFDREYTAKEPPTPIIPVDF